MATQGEDKKLIQRSQLRQHGEFWHVRPYQVIFLFLIQLLSGNKCGRAQSKHTQAKKHWVISVKNDHVMPGMGRRILGL